MWKAELEVVQSCPNPVELRNFEWVSDVWVIYIIDFWFYIVLSTLDFGDKKKKQNEGNMA